MEWSTIDNRKSTSFIIVNKTEVLPQQLKNTTLNTQLNTKINNKYEIKDFLIIKKNEKGNYDIVTKKWS